MLEQVDLSKRLGEEEYERRMHALRLKMYDLGHAVYVSGRPVIVVFEGWSGAGQSKAISELTERLDSRGSDVYPIYPPNKTERAFPWLYRFWCRVPAYGHIAIFDRSWYGRVLYDRVSKTVSKPEWRRAFQDIAEFERTLAADGTVLIKFFFHIDKAEEKRRVKSSRGQLQMAWEDGPQQELELKEHKRFLKAVEEMLARTSAEYAPWTLVPATDQQWANVVVYETVIARLEPLVGSQEAPLPPA
ncbi:MAG: polyphosphate kinase 2 family protein, partial [Rudaea sp.]